MKVCAVLMVKDEERVIARCLRSLIPIISDIVIVDTGSTDKTKQVIYSISENEKDVTFHCNQHEWINFGHNRNKTLEFARQKVQDADFFLLVDADMEVVGSLPDSLPHSSYNLTIHRDALRYDLPIFLKASMPWRYEGVVHEYITCDGAPAHALLSSLHVIDHQDGSSRAEGSNKRWERDMILLEDALAKEPDNSRNVFYLAQTYACLLHSYPDTNDLQGRYYRRKSIERYEQRASMGGFEEEIYYGLFQAGVLSTNPTDKLGYWSRASAMMPQRWEAAYEMAKWLNEQRYFQASYRITSQLLKETPASKGLFLHSGVYEWGILFEHSISTYYISEHLQSWEACNKLLSKKLPINIRNLTENNMAFSQERLFRKGA